MRMTNASISSAARGRPGPRWAVQRSIVAAFPDHYERSPGATIEAQSLRDGRRKTLVRGGTWGRFLASGHLVYVNQGTLFAVPFDPERLEVHGTPTPILEEVAYDSAWGSALIDFSHTGMLVYRSSKAAGGLVTVQWLGDGRGGVVSPRFRNTLFKGPYPWN
jgi:serine/threonine-protein kinase